MTTQKNISAYSGHHGIINVTEDCSMCISILKQSLNSSFIALRYEFCFSAAFLVFNHENWDSFPFIK